jgi:hypothetical protein
MVNNMRNTSQTVIVSAGIAVALLSAAGCSSATTSGIKKVQPGNESAGFLKDYSKLQPNAKLGGEIQTYVNADQAKHLKRYVAVKVDPVEVYLASNAEPSGFQVKVAEALSRYFERALRHAVADAFPVVEEPGPLVLRLRAAIVGVEHAEAPAEKAGPEAEPLDHAARIGNVRIEFEVVDSQTGEVVAAAVDRAALGKDAEVAAFRFERVQKSLAAKEAFDEWAGRVREFLDSEYEIADSDRQRVVDAYTPYGSISK